MQLRPYQSSVLEDVRQAHAAGHRRVLVIMPTGAGKTVTFSAIAGLVQARGGSVLILVPRIELVRQASSKLAALGIRHGLVAADIDQPDADASVQVAMAQTLVRRPDALVQAPSYIIIDECHLAAAETWTKILSRYPEARTLGVTATLERLDGSGFANLGSVIVRGPTVAEMIEAGNLCRFRTFTLPAIDTDALHKRAGEYDLGEQQHAFGAVVGDVVAHWQRLAAGRSTLLFAAGVEHSQKLAERFLSAGVAAEHLDGSMGADERRAILGRLASGETTVVTNFGVLTEGFDCPRVSCVQIARVTASRTLFRQMAGRGLRPCDGKTDCVIIDHGGNAIRHGNLDFDPPYSIEARIKTGRGSNSPAISKGCKTCAAVMPAAASACTVCGSAFVAEVRSVREKKGQLVELVSGYRPRRVGGWAVVKQVQAAGESWAHRRRT